MLLPKELTTVTPLSKTIALIMFTLLPIIAFILGMKYQAGLINFKPLPPPEQIACTMDAMLCPDGSSVGRSGPNCEFSPCPTVTDENNTFCGGIAGIACPVGYSCQLEGNYPDAGGVCIKEQEERVKPQITKSSDPQCCSNSLLEKRYRCVQNCGPPVARSDDPEPGYSCLSPQIYENRMKFGCPICLSSSTSIFTPQGNINIKSINVGTIVWTTDTKGEKIAQPVIKISSTLVPKNHKMLHLTLQDGRDLFVSSGHPTINGKTVDKLMVGDEYDSSRVLKTEVISYKDSKTYDILPAGETGFYWANRILMGSTLK
ncbi:hypothetical protein A3A74_03760 [Candidatus Roizmanbacteria bacterium RIFCSPLOWO2_01_FULL_35_13]|uniref:Hint domain-containing protein n=1 Tax=Candidatus Roizmanbacteria bacterium RIFCSPLOWO2_01_FULL_35_13 TaxID=1802055 RepID=A0A1F7IBH0_9BACT|nr:MAG: hypothetical protein A3A74_03760 [Candidatus Roizmanbacteria bacterium RIFCSPLOWO2_01_FULL_35_13]